MRTMFVAIVVAACAITVIGCKEKSTVTGEGGGQLTIHQPDAVKITRGGSAQVKIAIDRKGIEGPVSITFKDLPVGVTVAVADMKITGNEGTYTLMATDTAQLVANNNALVMATSAKNNSAEVKMIITVEEKK